MGSSFLITQRCEKKSSHATIYPLVNEDYCGKSPFTVDLPIYPLKMVIFHSYVSLPEGIIQISFVKCSEKVIRLSQHHHTWQLFSSERLRVTKSCATARECGAAQRHGTAKRPKAVRIGFLTSGVFNENLKSKGQQCFNTTAAFLSHQGELLQLQVSN